MPLFTITIDTVMDNWVFQVHTSTQEEALSKAIGMLPYQDGGDLSQDDENFLFSVANGKSQIVLVPAPDTVNVWSWHQGWRLGTPMYCHVIQTQGQAGQPNKSN